MDAKTLGDMPANPSHGTMGEVTHTGLTIRQEFAKAAMQGLASVPRPGGLTDTDIEYDVSAAVIYADALLAELAKDQP